MQKEDSRQSSRNKETLPTEVEKTRYLAVSIQEHMMKPLMEFGVIQYS